MKERDLSQVSTADLRAEFDAEQSKIKAAREALEPVKAELVKRENAETMILNAVMTGQQPLLRVAGVSDEVIKNAERKFAALKAEREATRAAAKGEVLQ